MPLFVFFLVDAAVGLVVGASVGADEVDEAVFCAPAISPAVGEEDCGGAHAEEAVREHHRALVPGVEIGGDDLGRNNEGGGIGVNLEEIASEIYGNEPGAAPHSGEIEAADVSAELVAVDDHGGERGRRAEEAAIDD